MRASRIEDGHSATQDAIYWHLWRAGKHVNGSRSRFAQAGYGQLERALKINRSNIQDALRELQRKFSLRVFRQASVGAATIYEVFCCDEVLAKRRDGGLLWVCRYGGRRADLLCGPDALTPTGPTPTDLPPIGVAPTAPIGVTPTHIAIEQIEQETSSSSSDPGPLQDAIEDLAVRSRLKRQLKVDDDAARKLEGFRLQLEATVDETACLLVDKMLDLEEHKGLYNPLGILLEKPDTWHTPRALKKLRDKRAAEQAERESSRQEAEEIRRQLESDYPHLARK